MGPTDFGTFLGILNSADPEKWTGKDSAADGYWRIDYAGTAPRCRLWVEFAEAAVTISSPLRIRIWGDCQLATYRYLLRLNEELVMTKFGMDSAGNISLNAELPRETVDYSQLEKAVRTIVFYVDQYFEDVRLVAEDREIAQSVTARELVRQMMDGELAAQVIVTEWQ